MLVVTAAALVPEMRGSGTPVKWLTLAGELDEQPQRG
jgi:hypothetical protein